MEVERAMVTGGQTANRSGNGRGMFHVLQCYGSSCSIHQFLTRRFVLVGIIQEALANQLIHSPADQVILEAEYKQNPKPNKAARADIVEKVTLNEKEVQVSLPEWNATKASPGAISGYGQLLMVCRYGSRTDAKSIDGSLDPFYLMKLPRSD